MNSATTAPLPPAGHRAFTSLANADFRIFFFAVTAVMMADNIEHVVGNAYQAQMPGFAMDLGHNRVDFAYSVLLAADAAGGLAGGVVMESRGLLPPKPRTAFILAMIWCCALFGFARSTTYAVAITLLFAAGFVELGFNSMAQSLVQLNAPGQIRGRVLGVFSMSAMGLRTFSGLSVGLVGSIVGIHNSLSYSAGALFMLYAALFAVRYAKGRKGKGGSG